MTDHPTDAERFFFDNNGYLVLEDFLAPDRVSALYAALERTIERRRDSQFKRAHEPAFADRLDAGQRAGHAPAGRGPALFGNARLRADDGLRPRSV